MADAVLEVAHLQKFYGDVAAVRDLNFRIEPGEVFGFLGPNGAGKTTLLRILSTLLSPNAGSVRLWNENVVECKERLRPRKSAGAPQRRRVLNATDLNRAGSAVQS